MTPRGTTIGQRLAAVLDDLREHERQHPGEVDSGTLPPPSTLIRDPRD